MAGLYGRTNLTLWLVVKRKGKEEGEKWKCCSDVGASTTRSGEPLWLDKPGSAAGGLEREEKDWRGEYGDCGGGCKLWPGVASLYGRTNLEATIANRMQTWKVGVVEGVKEEQWRAFMAGQSSPCRWGSAICQWDLCHFVGCICLCFYPLLVPLVAVPQHPYRRACPSLCLCLYFVAQGLEDPQGCVEWMRWRCLEVCHF